MSRHVDNNGIGRVKAETKTVDKKKKKKKRTTVVVRIPKARGARVLVPTDDSVVDLGVTLLGDHRSRLWPTNLLVDAYAPATIRKYTRGVSLFVAWCYGEGITDITDWLTMDLVLADYFQHLYAERIEDENAPGKSLAADTINGVLMFLPRGRYELLTAAKALRNWSRIDIGCSYPPLTRELVCLLAVTMMRQGHEREAIGTLLAFDCLLRVGELTALKKEDVSDVGDLRVSQEMKTMAIRLAKTKTGPNQFVTVVDATVRRLVKSLVQMTHKGGYLFHFTSDHYRRVFKKTCALLSLSPEYVPHSLRHGGATWLSVVGNTRVEDIMLRGRWASLKSVKRYIQVGKATLLTMEIPTKWSDLLGVIVKELDGLLHDARVRWRAVGKVKDKKNERKEKTK